MVEFDKFEKFVDRCSRSRRQCQGVDLDFRSIITIADDVASVIFSKADDDGITDSTTQENRNNVRCITYFGLAKRFFEILKDDEGLYTEVMSCISDIIVPAPETLLDKIDQIDTVKTRGGRSFKPRDVETLAIKTLFYAIYYANPQKMRKTNTTTIENVNFDYLHFNSEGDICEKRSATLDIRIRSLVEQILKSNHMDSLYMAQKALTVSSLWDLIWVENEIVRSHVLTHEQIQAVHEVGLPDHPNDDHRDAIREISGDANFSGVDEAVISTKSLRSKLDAIRQVGCKVRDHTGTDSHFVPI